MEAFKPAQEFCKKIIDSLNFAVTPYHVVELAKKKLSSAGFKEINETEPWTKLVPGDKYYLTRNMTALLAFSVGEKFEPKKGNMKIVAAHTDSPVLKFAPNSKMQKAGYLQVHFF